MKNPTTIEEIINWPKEYRVIADGREMQCRSIFFDDTTISLYTGDSDEFDKYQWYSPSEVKELTPLSYEGKRIAIGDWVQDRETFVWYQVFGYHYGYVGFILETLENGNMDIYCGLREDELGGHKTTKHDEEVEKAIKLLTDKRIIKDGKVIL